MKLKIFIQSKQESLADAKVMRASAAT